MLTVCMFSPKQKLIFFIPTGPFLYDAKIGTTEKKIRFYSFNCRICLPLWFNNILSRLYSFTALTHPFAMLLLCCNLIVFEASTSTKFGRICKFSNLQSGGLF